MGLTHGLSTENALKVVRATIESRDDELARAAVDALASWKNPSPTKDLLILAKDRSKPERQAKALAGYTRMLSLPANRPAMETLKFLEEALGLARKRDERRRIVAKLAEFPCKEALVLAEKQSQDEAIGETACAAAQKIRGVLIRSSLVATASHNSGETRRAFDKDPRSRWSTNTPMRPGMWFMVDLGAEHSVMRLILDSRNSPGDYPRGCEVFASFDGKNWGEPVLKSPPQRPVTRLIFEKPIRARFIKIVQTGETQGLYWSIHNLTVAFE